jgi:hypothetical protein
MNTLYCTHVITFSVKQTIENHWTDCCENFLQFFCSPDIFWTNFSVVFSMLFEFRLKFPWNDLTGSYHFYLFSKQDRLVENIPDLIRLSFNLGPSCWAPCRWFCVTVSPGGCVHWTPPFLVDLVYHILKWINVGRCLIDRINLKQCFSFHLLLAKNSLTDWILVVPGYIIAIFKVVQVYI